MTRKFFKPIQLIAGNPIREAKDRSITPHAGWEVIECKILIQVESDNEISKLKAEMPALYETYKKLALVENFKRAHDALKRLFATQKTSLSLPVMLRGTECWVNDNFYFNITPNEYLIRIGSKQLLHWSAHIVIEHTKNTTYKKIETCLLNEFQRNNPRIKRIQPKLCKENQPPCEHAGTAALSTKLTP